VVTKIAFDSYTLGFSNRSWEDTVDILQAFEIEALVDIRTLPGSKHTPQFNLEHMKQELPHIGIEYVHMKSLGGLRKPLKESTVNSGWQNSGFRGYADYMQTPAFVEALDQLVEIIKHKTTVYCCTEAVFWRCHRQLVSDALLVRGFRIGHIFNASKVEEHELTKFVKAQGTHLTYPSLL
jgi:uncharacterized protein (DUF488 family)